MLACENDETLNSTLSLASMSFPDSSVIVDASSGIKRTLLRRQANDELQGLTSPPHLLAVHPIVLIHGWGSNSNCWAQLMPGLVARADVVLLDLPGFFNREASLEKTENCYVSSERLYQNVAALLPERCLLVAWSLGGMIATQLAHRYADKIVGLITIASNLKFSAIEDWPCACDSVVFDQFYKGFSLNPSATYVRFCMLQAKGDAKRKSVLAALKKCDAYPQVGDNCRANLDLWQDALQLLNTIDNRAILPSLKRPGLHLFGEHDALVPVELADHIGSRSPPQRGVIIPAAGHAPHISQAPRVLEEIYTMLASIDASESTFDAEPAIVHAKTPLPQRDKKHVALSFGAAAQRYDSVAEVQKTIAKELVALKPDYQGLICDLGCGTGFCLDQIQSDNTTLLGLDISEAMLKVSRQKLSAERHTWLCADIEQLPLQSSSLDGLIASLSLQWCENLDVVFSQVASVLKPQAWMLVATLGPNTLHELRKAWQAVDSYVHVNRFAGHASVKAAIQNAGLVIETEIISQEVVYSPDVYSLMKGLKAIGAHNVNAGKNTGLTSRGAFQNLESAYEAIRTDKGLPATYDVYYFVLRAR
ncbi:MAG: malonyl-CoA O-methyltransferase [Lentisphaeria bacterium]|jgi:malonyl-CoA O-methyltransferase